MRSEAGRFEGLHETLLRAGIAPRRVKRYLAELDDHLAELTAREGAAGYDPAEAATRARALLGSEDELAQSWLSNPRLKSLTARAPWLVFGVLPPFALIAGFIIPLLVLMAWGFLMGFLPVHAHGPSTVPAWFRALVHAISLALNFLVGPLLLAWLARIVWRQRLSPVWLLLATGLFLLFFIRLDIVIGSPGLPMRVSVFSNLAALFTGKWHLAMDDDPAWQFLAQLFLTLLPALWLQRRFAGARVDREFT